jgi:hypothetical protein
MAFVTTKDFEIIALAGLCGAILALPGSLARMLEHLLRMFLIRIATRSVGVPIFHSLRLTVSCKPVYDGRASGATCPASLQPFATLKKKGGDSMQNMAEALLTAGVSVVTNKTTLVVKVDPKNSAAVQWQIATMAIRPIKIRGRE